MGVVRAWGRSDLSAKRLGAYATLSGLNSRTPTSTSLDSLNVRERSLWGKPASPRGVAGKGEVGG